MKADLHIQLEDVYMIQVFNQERESWELWGLAKDFTAAQQVVDHARDNNGCANTKVRIVKR